MPTPTTPMNPEIPEDPEHLLQRLERARVENERLLALWLAASVLDEALEAGDLTRGLADVVENILGASVFDIIERRPGELGWTVVASRDGTELTRDVPRTFAPTDEVTRTLLEAGKADFQAGRDPVWVIPFGTSEGIIGAVVVHRMLRHKPIMHDRDFDVARYLETRVGIRWLAGRALDGTRAKED